MFKTLKQCARKGWISRDTVEEICDLYLSSNAKSLDTADSDNVHYLTTE